MKISIVTPTYNRCDMLEDVIRNITAQKDRDFEHLIIDGGSTDGTLRMLEKYKHLNIVSELDDGIYDAMNKGIKRAVGDIILILNSDDLLCEDALKNIRKFFLQNPAVDTVCGGAYIFSDDSDNKIIYNDVFFKKLDENSICHGNLIFNARVYRKRVFDKTGLMDPSYKIASDRDFTLRLLYTPDLQHGTIDEVLYAYRAHADSLTFSEKSDHRIYFHELLKISQNGMRKYKQNKHLYNAYRKWHAWAIMRYLFTKNHVGDLSKKWIETKNAFRSDLFWPARAFNQVLCHLSLKRKARNMVKTI